MAFFGRLPGWQHSLAIGLLAATAFAQSTAELERFLGQRVTAIRFILPGGEVSGAELERLREAMTLKSGEPLTRTALSSSLKAIYAIQRYGDVEIHAEPADDGIILTFNATPNYFIGDLIVTGEPRPPTANQLINASKLELGRRFAEEEMNDAIERMKRVMEDNGYYLAKITPHVEYSEADQLVIVRFTVDRGPRTRVGEVKVVGNTGYPEERIRNIAKMHTGDKVSVARSTRALRRLRSRYQKDDRLEAEVSVSRGDYHLDTNRLDYVIRAERGPKVDIRVEGASMRKGLIKKYVPVYEENAVDDDLLNEGRRNMRDYWQTKGFFDVTVDFERRTVPEADRMLVVYDTDRGERHKLTHVDIEGNRYFGDEVIRERMRVTPSSLLLFYGLFSQTMLSRDVQSIETLYRDNGFLNVTVTTDVEDDYKGEEGRMRVVIRIDEGAQSRVSSLTIEGNQAFSDDDLSGLIDTAPGQPYSEATLAKDRDTIVNYYFNNGFADVRFEATSKPTGEPNRLDVAFKITENRQQFVNRVLLTGLHNTRRYVVERELEIQDNEPMSQAAMIETQRRLYDLGIFNEVNIAVQNPDSTLDRKDLILQVEEAKRYTFSYGVGLEVQTGDVASECANLPNPAACQPQGRMGVSPRVSFDITRLNFLGRDHTILLKSRLGRLQQRGLISYEAPWWFGERNMTLTFTSFFDKTQDVRTFTAERLEGSAQITHRLPAGALRQPTTLLYRMTYRRVQVDPTTLQVDPNDIPLLSRPVRVGFPSVTYVRDTRDNPIESHFGNYNTADFSVAAGIFGSESSFVRLFFQNSTYHPFGRPNVQREQRWVFARSTRVGVEVPYGSPANSFVPLPERFFIGGGNSHRGFAINQAGPRDLVTGFPLGGLSVFLNNLELRTPPISLPFVQDNLSVVFFHDAGNVFESTDDLATGFARWKQKEPERCQQQAVCDFRYIAHAVGAGLRYRTPIGPVRVDFGYNLTPTHFPIQNQSRSDTLQRFNFFFSIGQTF